MHPAWKLTAVNLLCTGSIARLLLIHDLKLAASPIFKGARSVKGVKLSSAAAAPSPSWRLDGGKDLSLCTVLLEAAALAWPPDTLKVLSRHPLVPILRAQAAHSPLKAFFMRPRTSGWSVNVRHVLLPILTISTGTLLCSMKPRLVRHVSCCQGDFCGGFGRFFF